jgi:hypothetical protein
MNYFLYKKNKVIDKLTDNQIFIKKLTERYGLIVKKLSLSNKSSNTNKKDIIKSIFMKYEEDNSDSIIEAIQKESNKKTKYDTSIIRNFLSNCHLFEFFILRQASTRLMAVRASLRIREARMVPALEDAIFHDYGVKSHFRSIRMRSLRVLTRSFTT